MVGGAVGYREVTENERERHVKECRVLSVECWLTPQLLASIEAAEKMSASTVTAAVMGEAWVARALLTMVWYCLSTIAQEVCAQEV